MEFQGSFDKLSTVLRLDVDKDRLTLKLAKYGNI